jgi:hypothetical protein
MVELMVTLDLQHTYEPQIADTVLQSFLEAVGNYGVPSHVRSDHGRESYYVGQFMLAYRGVERGSIITGRSVQNQRIERLWRDVYCTCLHQCNTVSSATDNNCSNRVQLSLVIYSVVSEDNNSTTTTTNLITIKQYIIYVTKKMFQKTNTLYTA